MWGLVAIDAGTKFSSSNVLTAKFGGSVDIYDFLGRKVASGLEPLTWAARQQLLSARSLSSEMYTFLRKSIILQLGIRQVFLPEVALRTLAIARLFRVSGPRNSKTKNAMIAVNGDTTDEKFWDVPGRVLHPGGGMPGACSSLAFSGDVVILDPLANPRYHYRGTYQQWFKSTKSFDNFDAVASDMSSFEDIAPDTDPFLGKRSFWAGVQRRSMSPIITNRLVAHLLSDLHDYEVRTGRMLSFQAKIGLCAIDSIPAIFNKFLWDFKKPKLHNAEIIVRRVSTGLDMSQIMHRCALVVELSNRLRQKMLVPSVKFVCPSAKRHLSNDIIDRAFDITHAVIPSRRLIGIDYKCADPDQDLDGLPRTFDATC
jgi:hypothetical protein